MGRPGSGGPAAVARRHATAIRVVSLALIAAGAMLIARRVPIGAIGRWAGGLGPWGPVAFGLAYALGVVLMVPGSAMTLVAGASFGILLGTITVSLASTAGAALAFLIARYLARDAVAARVREDPRYEAVDRAIAAGGWKVVALLRLSPAVPFNVQNYLYGLTAIRFWPCVLTSWIAMLPGTVLYVSLGHAGRAGIEAAAGGGRRRGAAEWAALVVGLLATVAVTGYVTHLARRALRGTAGIAEARPGPEPAAPEGGP